MSTKELTDQLANLSPMLVLGVIQYLGFPLCLVITLNSKYRYLVDLPSYRRVVYPPELHSELTVHSDQLLIAKCQKAYRKRRREETNYRLSMDQKTRTDWEVSDYQNQPGEKLFGFLPAGRDQWLRKLPFRKRLKKNRLLESISASDPLSNREWQQLVDEHLNNTPQANCVGVRLDRVYSWFPCQIEEIDEMPPDQCTPGDYQKRVAKFQERYFKSEIPAWWDFDRSVFNDHHPLSIYWDSNGLRKDSEQEIPPVYWALGGFREDKCSEERQSYYYSLGSKLQEKLVK